MNRSGWKKALAPTQTRALVQILAFLAMVVMMLAGCDQPGETGNPRVSPSAGPTTMVSVTTAFPFTVSGTTASAPTASGTMASGTTASSTTALADTVAIRSLTTRDVGRTVTVIGTIRAIRRYDSGHALVTLADAGGTLRVYIRKETGVDPMSLTVDEAYAISGRIQLFEGQIELAPAAAGDIRLTDGYDFEPVEVLSVIDGDTVRIRDRGGRTQTLRIIGVDTPERATDSRPEEFYYAEATAFAERTLRGRTIYLERDNSEVDQYGRLLRYVWLTEPTMITRERLARDNYSALLLQGGYAEFVVFGDDNKYERIFESWEQQAQQARKGMWSRG